MAGGSLEPIVVDIEAVYCCRSRFAQSIVAEWPLELLASSTAARGASRWRGKREGKRISY